MPELGCNCGGAGGRSFVATTGGSSWSAAARPSDRLVWIVTFPDGRSEEFDSDSEAYRAIARTGGGIRSEVRPR